METQELLASLSAQNEQLLHKAIQLKNGKPSQLRQRPSSDSWNVLECLEHLNLYARHYIPEIRIAIRSNSFPPSDTFKPGMLGDYFAESMLPKPQTKKMKTFKSKNPIHRELDLRVIDEYIQQQQELLQLLQAASKANLNRVKIKTSLSPLLRLNLGDTFRFYTNHMLRHFAQIDRILTGA